VRLWAALDSLAERLSRHNAGRVTATKAKFAFVVGAWEKPTRNAKGAFLAATRREGKGGAPPFGV